ncbi:hypothetical protein BGX26_000706, partial [Mortierella sp. AD094]
MLNINVQKETRLSAKVVGVFGWLLIISASTYQYIKHGCPHLEQQFASSCKPYTYGAGLVPTSNNPPIYAYQSFEANGTDLSCFLERFMYSYQLFERGHVQNVRSEIHCGFKDPQTGSVERTDFAYVD